MFSWFWDTLSYLGLYNKRARLLFLGLDNAGKTTLMHMLKHKKMMTGEPTRHPQGEEIMIGAIRFKTFDMGGHQAARRLWRDYYANLDGIIFMVDAYDRDRFNEACVELGELLGNEQLQHVPFVILGNKIDRPNAASEDELRTALGLHNLTTGKTSTVPEGIRPLELFMCSVVRRAGYADAFKWLANFL